MLSVDLKKSATNYPNLGNSFNESDDEKSFSKTANKKDLVLPSLKIQNPLNLNISADLIKSEEEKPEENKVDNQRPKMYNYFFCYILFNMLLYGHYNFIIFFCIIKFLNCNSYRVKIYKKPKNPNKEMMNTEVNSTIRVPTLNK